MFKKTKRAPLPSDDTAELVQRINNVTHQLAQIKLKAINEGKTDMANKPSNTENLRVHRRATAQKLDPVRAVSANRRITSLSDPAQRERVKRQLTGVVLPVDPSDKDTARFATISRALADHMTAADYEAEAFCEQYNCRHNSFTQGLYLTTGAIKETQKLAQDTLHNLAAHFASGPDGVPPPLGITHNADGVEPLTGVVAYATSRPGQRWAIGPSCGLADVAEHLADDARCDLAAEPFAKNLERYRFNPGEDCIAKMAELADCKRQVVEQNLSSIPPDWKIGELFPVALGNHVVFLKICGEHIAALYKKYEVDFKACEIVNPWEGLGNHW